MKTTIGYAVISVLIRLSLSMREYAASVAESSVITSSFRFYFHFLHIVKGQIKTFTSINLVISLHVQTCTCVISISSP